MTILRRMTIAAAILITGAAALFATAAIARIPKPQIAAIVVPDTDTATVKVIMPSGIGSGVHIGNGFVLTAAHVAGDEKSLELKSKDGQSRQADVLWVNKTYDIALLRTSPATLGSAHLTCRTADLGENVEAIGNPLNVDFIQAYGRIAGEPRALGPWKSVFVTDMTTVMGQSGGPTFAANGDLIGITVGVMSANLGFSPSIVGYGFVVPSTAICGLLGRII